MLERIALDQRTSNGLYRDVKGLSMAFVEWEIKAREFGNCNCDYGCPCQFNALPTHGNCQAVVGYEISEGHFGDTQLDGLRAVYVGKWPGAVHEGNGEMQVIIDERADDTQREALCKILYGEETDPGTTVWNVFMTTITTVHDPLYAPIEFDVDIDARRAHLRVPNLIEGSGEPIRNPVTGAEHRARIELPNGFEYTVAEVGSGTSTASAAIPLALSDSYGQFAHLHLSTHGVVR
jgi:hypothetical protein